MKDSSDGLVETSEERFILFIFDKQTHKQNIQHHQITNKLNPYDSLTNVYLSCSRMIQYVSDLAICCCTGLSCLVAELYLLGHKAL
jgi:hypothetical protein